MGADTQIWRPPPPRVRLEASMIHVWRAKYVDRPHRPEAFTASLSAEEKARADRFVRASDRDRFIFAHGMLRSILARYTGCRPRQIVLKTNAYGKPALAGPTGPEGLRFNLAHSGDMVLVALGRDDDLGVDVEFIRSMSDLHQMIKRCFSQEEQRYFGRLPEDQMQRTFFIYWTLKEAYLKGIGLGLSYPLEAVRMQREQSQREFGDLYAAIPMDRPRWQCLPISPWSGYIGALAAETIHTAPHFWDYEPAEGR
jgi:4'-phosphopantetheinyl transferase